jgi:hypothetical protein
MARKPKLRRSQVDDDAQDGLAPLLKMATGVRTNLAQSHLVNQALNALWWPSGEPLQDDVILALIEVMAAIKPGDGLEGMLAAQMVATHETAMECLRRAALPKQTFEGRDQNLKHAAKLLGVYERQLAALDKHRGKGRQKVTVKHVHVNEGGQAIVGNVTRGTGTPETGGEQAAALEGPRDQPMAVDVPEAQKPERATVQSPRSRRGKA